MKKLIQKIINAPKFLRRKRLRVGDIIYISDQEIEGYKIAHAVSPTETGVCEGEGCDIKHFHTVP